MLRGEPHCGWEGSAGKYKLVGGYGLENMFGRYKCSGKCHAKFFNSTEEVWAIVLFQESFNFVVLLMM